MTKWRPPPHSWPASVVYVRCDGALVDAIDLARERLANAEGQHVSRGELARRILELLLLKT